MSGRWRFRSAVLRCWAMVTLVLMAAPSRAEEHAGLDEAPITADDRDHWAFRELARPAVPKVRDETWVRSDVDRFVLAALEDEGFKPAGPADRKTLVRRLYFDLVGLPPSPDDVRRFVDDWAPQAYERLVDRLLASPHYGERWAQHWLDLARFAETDGFEHDKIRPNAWKYRDWVISALNDNLPYDEFLRLQIAGDVIAPDDSRAVTATAFCLSGQDMPDINSQEERKQTLLNEITATVGSVFLGLQMGCAQCHDHKYDPVSQADFYRLRAFFAPAVRVEKNKPVERLVSASGKLLEPSHLLLRGDWRRPGPEVEPAFPRIADRWSEPPSASDADERRLELANWMTRDDHPLTSRVIVNRVWQHHFGRGLSNTPSDFGLLGEEPTHPELLDWLALEFVERGGDLKALHRLIVNSAVYRQSSVAPDGSAALEDWQKAQQSDPTNDFLWRFPRQRLDAEIVRDAMLVVAGVLNKERGGPGVRPPLPEELVGTLLKDQWVASERESDHYRRSIYVFARRNLRYPLFEVFDRPAATASCAQRSQTTTARQSLLMLNSQFVLEMSRRLAGRVWEEAGKSPGDQITAAVTRALVRAPAADELAEMVNFLQRQRSLLASEGRPPEKLSLPITSVDIEDPYAAAALTDLCLALLNSSEFVYVD